jgi:hypothetical protein
MKRLAIVLATWFAVSHAAHAQEWQTYTYPDPGFAIEFPGIPSVETTKVRTDAGVTLPVTRYVVRQDGAQYTLSVVDYSSTNADALSTIRETAKSFGTTGKVIANQGRRVGANHGRELTVAEADGSRSDVAIFFVDNHLYVARGQSLPPRPMDTVRFSNSVQFPAADSGFLGLFGAGRTGAVGQVGRSALHPGTMTDQSADAACAGKSPGDVVQLETSTGPVSATCILTARPDASKSK